MHYKGCPVEPFHIRPKNLHGISCGSDIESDRAAADKSTVRPGRCAVFFVECFPKKIISLSKLFPSRRFYTTKSRAYFRRTKPGLME
jgi:hypothetical protein